MRQLRANITGTDKDQALGQRLQLQKRFAIEGGNILDAADRRDQGLATGRDQHFWGGNPAASNLDAALNQSGWTFIDVIDPLVVGQQIGIFLLAQRRDQIVLSRHELGPVINFGTARKAGKTCRSARPVQRLSRADHGLRGNAAEVHTGATNCPMSYERHAFSSLGTRNRSREPRRACAHHDEVICLVFV